MQTSRREFLQFVTASGIALSLSRLAVAAPQGFAARETMPGGSWNPAAGGMGRIDGVAKVTGAKLYASDYRAADMPGWPSNTAHAWIIRAADASHVFAGLDLSRLTGAAKPDVVATAADVARINAKVPEFYAGDLFCPVGKTPYYLGQPLAMLIFERFDGFDQARLILRDHNPVQLGAKTGPLEGPDFGAYRITRVAGATPDAPDVYSTLMDGQAIPPMDPATGRRDWTPGVKNPVYMRAARHGEAIRAGLKDDDQQLVLEREFETQFIDPMFLEPEGGLAWYDTGQRNLEIVLGVQSPFDTAEAIGVLLGGAKRPFKPAKVSCHFAHMGGGFGGRDHTHFPLYLALAAMFAPGKPVRLAHDRYQQFQAGIKRHPFKMKTRLGVDRKSGRITALAADHVLDGGGLANFSASVAWVGSTASLGVYDVPKADITTIALHSRAPTAGSMRAYGTIQTMTALEVMVDEVAAELKIDPIAFRRRNMLPQKGHMITGNPYFVSVRTPEILDKLEKHPIWTERAAHKGRAEAGTVVGTGVAVATKDYGSGADASQGRVELDPEGRIAIFMDYVEMGTGTGTGCAARVAKHLGKVADTVSVARIDTFEAMGLITSDDPFTIEQKVQDAAAKNPRWVPAISTASSASVGAHVGTHGATEAARVIFHFGLWPAALEMWGISPNDARAKKPEAATWKDGQLTLAKLRPLPLKALAARAHARGYVTGAMTHAFNRWSWTTASFEIGKDKTSTETWTAEIDGLAVRRGKAGFQRIDRSSVAYPPTLNNRIAVGFTTLCGTLVRVEIEKATGRLKIAKAYSVFECGEPLVPGLILGQSHGGFAMGVGQALHEYLPPYEDGPGNGQWNLGQYTVVRGSDLPLHDLQIEMLPPLPNEAPKGMAEVVMIPVVAALLNAIHDATGKRFQALPVTQAQLKGAIA